MRKVFPMLLLLLTVTLTSFSQEINELDFLTSSKWLVESIQIGDEAQNHSEENSWMYFNSDGTYKIVMSNDEKSGVWKFDEENKAIQFVEENNLTKSFKIITLNEKDFLFSATEGDLMYTMRFKR